MALVPSNTKADEENHTVYKKGREKYLKERDGSIPTKMPGRGGN